MVPVESACAYSRDCLIYACPETGLLPRPQPMIFAVNMSTSWRKTPGSCKLPKHVS